jgi:hypothetical protein
MDARCKDGEGLTICPVCGKHYRPYLEVCEDALLRKPRKSIQEIFPDGIATPAQREQMLSGICSDECWNKFLGPEE